MHRSVLTLQCGVVHWMMELVFYQLADCLSPRNRSMCRSAFMSVREDVLVCV